MTEADAGSDPSRIKTTARRTDDGWVIDGEKWFVTYGDVAAVYIVMAKALVDGQEQPTLFLVDRDSDGIEVVDDPPFTHTYPHGHPTIRFTGVEVPDDAVVGGVGGGDDLQRAWFTEERLGIAARGVGSMWRLIEETTAWAIGREQGGNRLIDYQGVSFPLADSAADAAAGRLLTLEVARLADAGADPKVVHAKASMAKLFVSEAACRCADRAVQIFGGRGYMRTNVAERFNRELRVDRIWEGTSEIQRLIVARALERRGVERTSALVRRLLHPRTIAVVGANDRPGSYSGETLLNLARLGYPGTVWGVNPSREEAHGVPCFPSLSDLPEPPDAVVVAIPAAGVAAVVEEAGAIGCGGAVVYGAASARSPRAPRWSASWQRPHAVTTCPCAARTATASWRCTSGWRSGGMPCARSSPAGWRSCRRAATWR